MNTVYKIFSIFLLVGAILFNLWIYRLEPHALTDPNDNAFQFALVDRTNQVWDFAQQKCSGNPFCFLSFLVDHWVPNWAQGYNLPYYYSHIPQIVIVASHRLLHFLFHSSFSLFTYYHWVIYLLLCVFPLSMFVALRIVRRPWLTAGIGALVAAGISTDGLYGLDPSSFLWRGYGLSAQLFAMMWLPLAIAYAWRFLDSQDLSKRDLILAVLFTSLATASHLGIGIIAFLSMGLFALKPILALLLVKSGGIHKDIVIKTMAIEQTKRLLFLFGGVFLLLGYWIIPVFLGNNYHNISMWDPIWKFNSYGAKEVLKNLANGDLFDFGRFPVLTVLTFFGLFAAFEVSGLMSLALLFIFWLLLYFGRTSWGGLVDLIPGMTEFHLSRFIVGVHISGLFLAPIGAEWIFEKYELFVKRIKKIPTEFILIGKIIAIGVFIVITFPQAINYASFNDIFIKRANDTYAPIAQDVNRLVQTLHERIQTKPGRVFPGRGGGWGKDFRVAETNYFMYLSSFGIPTVLWLPETWSPNSDTEQYFSEDQLRSYALYNIRYVAAPPDVPPQQFWRLLEESKTWKLYEIDLPTSYITTGVRPAVVSSSKENFLSVIRLWIQSDYHVQGLYPELTFDTDYPKKTGLPNFRMSDIVTYTVPNGSTHNLFAEPPVYMTDEATAKKCAGMTVMNEKIEGDMIFSATVNAPSVADDCIIILRQSFHPSWGATIDGKPVKPFIVFPFYIAVNLPSSGTHEVVFSYQPSPLKQLLLAVSLMTLCTLVSYSMFHKIKKLIR